jgi:hypothetical protein
MDKQKKSLILSSMTPNETEQMQADVVLTHAIKHAEATAHPGDVQAAAVGILVAAVELATPDLTPKIRASLFHPSQALPPADFTQLPSGLCAGVFIPK